VVMLLQMMNNQKNGKPICKVGKKAGGANYW
jgi:hypothetical protein